MEYWLPKMNSSSEKYLSMFKCCCAMGQNVWLTIVNQPDTSRAETRAKPTRVGTGIVKELYLGFGPCIFKRNLQETMVFNIKHWGFIQISVEPPRKWLWTKSHQNSCYTRVGPSLGWSFTHFGPSPYWSQLIYSRLSMAIMAIMAGLRGERERERDIYIYTV